MASWCLCRERTAIIPAAISVVAGPSNQGHDRRTTSPHARSTARALQFEGTEDQQMADERGEDHYRRQPDERRVSHPDIQMLVAEVSKPWRGKNRDGHDI